MGTRRTAAAIESVSFGFRAILGRSVWRLLSWSPAGPKPSSSSRHPDFSVGGGAVVCQAVRIGFPARQSVTAARSEHASGSGGLRAWESPEGSTVGSHDKAPHPARSGKGGADLQRARRGTRSKGVVTRRCHQVPIRGGLPVRVSPQSVGVQLAGEEG